MPACMLLPQAAMTMREICASSHGENPRPFRMAVPIS